MSTQKGLLVTCDRCGAQTFRAHVGTGETDGGFTRWDKFEPAPDGWGFCSDVGTVCPACNSEYEQVIEKFKRNGRPKTL